jgi:hypothetical protein
METIRKIRIGDTQSIVVEPDRDEGGWVQISIQDGTPDSSYIMFDPKYAEELAKAITLCGKELLEQQTLEM